MFRSAIELLKTHTNNFTRFTNVYIKSKPFHSTAFCQKENQDNVVVYQNFENAKEKTKNSYLEMIKIFENRDVHRRGHVEFIYSALKNMKDFNVHKDAEVYKALIDVLPKGKFIPTNMFQAEFMHYPKQQQCAIDLLEQMEDNGVMPDYEFEDILMNIFGSRGHPLRKFWRMMYWMPKFKNLSPWPVPDPVPHDIFDIAKIAIERIASVDSLSNIIIYKTSDIEDSIEDTWVVSSQSVIQQQLLQQHDKEKPVFVEGPFKIWIKDKSVNYFILKGESKLDEDYFEDTDDVSNLEIIFPFSPPKKDIAKIPSVHEQKDGIIYAVCATGTSGKDSLLSWIRHLEKDGNSDLSSIPVVFKLRSSEKALQTFDTNVNDVQS